MRGEEPQTRINNSLQRPARIEVCGGIASGKTTFALLLGSTGISTVLENFQANPFLALFYSDTEKFAFETEITFLLQHYNQIKVESQCSRTFICDFSLYLDLAYTAVTLHGTKRQVFEAVHKEVYCELKPPDLLVYLRCSAATELQRIRSRKRAVEQSINIEFLSSLNSSLEYFVNQIRDETRVIEIDSEKLNFAVDKFVREDMVDLIQGSLSLSHITSKCD